MIYPVVLYGHPVLKKKAGILQKTDLKNIFIEDLFETMHNAKGVGLAAPQVGESKQIFVIDTKGIEENPEKVFKGVFINPVILKQEGRRQSYEEGCLSIPGIREDIERMPRITIRYTNINWEEIEKSFVGIQARIIQHEYDHLQGILFTDYLTPLKRRLLKGKLTDISKGKVDAEYKVEAMKRLK